ncbi:hypothetical protein BHM03_00052798 [Ensete ventricosum]|nr:hypothetical protein BHM03_00052798 [Ensete ventricosum]
MTKSQGLGMGRCARKPKIDGKAAVTEAVHHQPSLGVHTRAKTLALKSLQETSPYTASSYLQLRSRRLEKHLPVPAFARSRAAARNRPNAEPNPNSNPSPAPGHSRSPNLVNQAAGRGESPVNSDSVGSVPTKSNCFKMTKATAVAVREASPEVDAAETEGASGENVLEFDAFRLGFLDPCKLWFLCGHRDSSLVLGLGFLLITPFWGTSGPFCYSGSASDVTISTAVRTFTMMKLICMFFGCRTARETTHCDLITDSETIGMPGSATWCTKFTASKRQAPNPSSIPTNLEMEELFAVPEQLQQRSFVLRYGCLGSLNFSNIFFPC